MLYHNEMLLDPTFLCYILSFAMNEDNIVCSILCTNDGWMDGWILSSDPFVDKQFLYYTTAPSLAALSSYFSQILF